GSSATTEYSAPAGCGRERKRVSADTRKGGRASSRAEITAHAEADAADQPGRGRPRVQCAEKGRSSTSKPASRRRSRQPRASVLSASTPSVAPSQRTLGTPRDPKLPRPPSASSK